MTYKYPLKIMKVEDDIGVCLFLYIVIYFMVLTLGAPKLAIYITPQFDLNLSQYCLTG